MAARRKGFYYSYDDEKIRQYSRLSAKEKLEWLYEANQFCKKALTRKLSKVTPAKAGNPSVTDSQYLKTRLGDNRIESRHSRQVKFSV